MTSNPDLVLLVIGLMSIVFMYYRIYLVLGQEFPEDDTLFKDPLTYAASQKIDFEKFKESSWQGFEALIAVVEFRTFYKRFGPLIFPRDARLVLLGLLASFLIAITMATIFKAEPKVNAYIGGASGIINLLWSGIIEYAKSLKKAVIKLRVT